MKNTTSRFFGLLLVGLAAFLTTFGPTASGQSFGTCLPPAVLDAEAAIIDIEAQGSDLHVTIGWDALPTLPETATLRVLSHDGQVVATTLITPKADDLIDEIVVGALADVETYGLAYRIELDPALAAPYPFHVGFDCSGSLGDCLYVLTGGLETNAVVTDHDLGPVLDSLGASGSDDALADALAANPSYWVPRPASRCVSTPSTPRRLSTQTTVPVYGSAPCRDPQASRCSLSTNSHSAPRSCKAHPPRVAALPFMALPNSSMAGPRCPWKAKPAST